MSFADTAAVREAAHQLGLHESQLYDWRRKLRVQSDKSQIERDQATEIARLKRQLAMQAEELSIVKKSAKYFAKNPKWSTDSCAITWSFLVSQKWVGDITCLWTDAGWLYLATVIDLYSRLVVGWTMSERMTASLVCDALTMRLWRRGMPSISQYTQAGAASIVPR